MLYNVLYSYSLSFKHYFIFPMNLKVASEKLKITLKLFRLNLPKKYLILNTRKLMLDKFFLFYIIWYIFIQTVCMKLITTWLFSPLKVRNHTEGAYCILSCENTFYSGGKKYLYNELLYDIKFLGCFVFYRFWIKCYLSHVLITVLCLSLGV